MGVSIKKLCYDGNKKFNINEFDTSDTGKMDSRGEAVNEFINNLKEINKYQQKLYADRREGVIFIFQAMDAAGKDGVIRTVFGSLSPHGVREYCFKAPSTEELNHDFLWRFWNAMPSKGNISIFNRSYYEDVLVGRVHKLYKNQRMPDRLSNIDIIKSRYESIVDYEKYLYHTGTRVVKIFLNVSKDEQGKRFISRIDTPRKNWKISINDIEERKYWDEYMEAFEDMINITSTKNSPWYVVPADHKWFARLIVSRIILKTLKDMNSQWPLPEDMTKLQEVRKDLYESLDNKNLDIEEFDEVFSQPTKVFEDMFIKDEKDKIIIKSKKMRKSGFDAVNKLMADDCVLTSYDDIVNAVVKENSKLESMRKEK